MDCFDLTDITAHGENLNKFSKESGLPIDRIIDFSANINPSGPPEWLISIILKELDLIANYPDPNSLKLVKELFKNFSIKENQIIHINILEKVR